MAEITRKHQKVFGGNLSPSGNIAVYGSKLAGAVAYSDNLDTIQNNSWLVGLLGAISPNKAPYVQDLNAIFYVLSKQLAYIFQAGIPEWNSQTEYFAGKSVVLRSGKIYKSIYNSKGIEPEVTNNWSNYWLCTTDWGYLAGNIYKQTDLWNILTKGMWYNSTIANAIDGYPTGTILNYTDTNGNTYLIMSLVDNNKTAPSQNNIKFSDDQTGVFYWKKISQERLVFDTKPKKSSINPVTSGGINDTIGITPYALDNLISKAGDATYTVYGPFNVPYLVQIGLNGREGATELQASSDGTNWKTIVYMNINYDDHRIDSDIKSIIMGAGTRFRFTSKAGSHGSFVFNIAPLYEE